MPLATAKSLKLLKYVLTESKLQTDETEAAQHQILKTDE